MYKLLILLLLVLIISYCSDDSPTGTDVIDTNWHNTSLTGVPIARSNHTAIWTGTEMIIWGGYNTTETLDFGGRYNVSTDTWKSISSTNCPQHQIVGHTTIWTGTEMIV